MSERAYVGEGQGKEQRSEKRIGRETYIHKFSHYSSLSFSLSILLSISPFHLTMVGPVEGQGPRLVAHVVADKVHVTSIDEHAHAPGKHVRDQGLVVLHPIAIKHGMHLR